MQVQKVQRQYEWNPQVLGLTKAPLLYPKRAMVTSSKWWSPSLVDHEVPRRPRLDRCDNPSV